MKLKTLILATALVTSVTAGAQAPVNLALKASRTSSSTCRPEYPPPGAVDGDRNTSFSVALGAAKGQWYEIDWSSPQKIGGLAFYQPDRYTASFDVEMKQNSQWVKVKHVGAPDQQLGASFYVTFEPRVTEAIRFVNIDSTNVGGAAYYEIEVYSDPHTVLAIQNRVDVLVSGDSTGRLIGTVSKENGSKGVVGTTVKVSGSSPSGAWTREVITKDNGLFVADLPLNPSGVIEVKAVQGELHGATSVNAIDIPQRLTPRPTKGRISLEGTWDFLPDPPKDFQTQTQNQSWKPIKVPSNYEMEGYTTKTDTAAYRKAVTIPKEWAGKRVRVRAEGIYSSCEVWLNGKRVGSHDGGATPFDLDLTDAAKPGQPNEMCILVHARSTAAMIDNMSVYAYFEVAGIWRPIEVYAVEPTHVERLVYSTVFDSAFKDATLNTSVKIANEQGKAVNARVLLKVLDPKGKELKLEGLQTNLTLGAWEAKNVDLKTLVNKPQQWNAELPRNYKLIATVRVPGQADAVVEQPLGFRQVEIKGNKFSINGKPVRLFGSCMHSADPLMGRAIDLASVRRDLEMMKGANLNAIRTSHYPPHPMMPGVADEKGLYIEDEGPSCWAGGSEDLRNAPLYMGIVTQYVERDRNHPSVVYYSTCNESNYGIIFQLTHRYVKQLDPTRPVGGTYAPESMDNDAYAIHHPTNLHEHIQITKKINKAVFYDEAMTIFHGWGDLADSLEIDPGMHDYWETNVLKVRRAEMEAENQVGVMIWAWVDDAFAIPGRGIGYWRRDLNQIRYTDSVYKLPGRGYQGDVVWGIVDGWRRPRPQWWLLKKNYTPVLIEEKPLALPSAGTIRVPVENLNWFANLGAYECRWEIGGHKGKIRANVEPSSKGFLDVATPFEVKESDVLKLDWIDETGRLVDAYKLSFKAHAIPTMTLGKPALTTVEDYRYLSGARAVYLKGSSSELAYDQVSGVMMWGLKDNEQVLLYGPRLHVLNGERPTADDPGEWHFTSETHEPGGVHWNGKFGKDYEGGYTIRMDDQGQIEVSYSFVYKGAEFYAREVGLQFDLPLAFDKLSWDRAADHSVYPDDHIGRPVGSALAHPLGAQTTPPGARPFGLDDHPWGSNDFRSSKRNIYWATLTNAIGQGLKVVSDGTQTVRCTMGVHGIALKVSDFYGGSGGKNEWSVLGFQYGPGKLIKPGDVLKGTVRLQMLSRAK